MLQEEIHGINSGNPIEIQNYTDVAITMDISGSTNLDPSDYIFVQYSLDGSNWTNFSTNGQVYDDFTATQASQTGINGTNLWLQIICRNNNSEYHYIDNISVTGTLSNNYYSTGSGNANTLTNWNSERDGSGSTPTDLSNGLFYVENGDVITMTANWNLTGGLTVETGGSLNSQSFELTGLATFTVESNANLLLGHANGINGNIQTTGTQDFNVGANYTYNGTVAQVTGTNLPNTINNLVVNNTNAGGVSLSGSLVVNSLLDLQQGALAINGQTLTLNGTVDRTGAGTGTLSGSNASTLQITGTGALGTLYFTGGSETLLNLTINRTSSGTVSFGTNLTIGTSGSGTLTLTEGIVNPGANTITVANVAQGAIVGGSTTSYINGSLQRYFPASTSGSSTYLFPLGENSNYRPLELIDIETGVSPNATATVSPTGATNADASITPLFSQRNWYVNGTDLTSAFVKITESGMTSTNTLGISTTAQSGAYSSAGGVGTSTITSSSTVTTFPAWFAIGTLNIKTYYSYQDGDWDNPDTWTLDPSGTVKVGNDIPTDGDFVVVLSGRTVTLTSDVTNTDLDITIDAAGFLNLSTFQFTNTLLELSGQGTLQLASINFPAATTNTFINTGGGTTEYNNTVDFTLPISQTEYNNLTINTAVGISATQLNNLTLNGDFR